MTDRPPTRRGVMALGAAAAAACTPAARAPAGRVYSVTTTRGPITFDLPRLGPGVPLFITDPKERA